MKKQMQDSLNVVDDFMFDLSKDNIEQRQSKGYNYGGVDLEYSADSDTHQNILTELRQQMQREEQMLKIQKKQQQMKAKPKIIIPQKIKQPEKVPVKEQQKKKERKTIFDKYKPNVKKEVTQTNQQKKDLMNTFDEIFHPKDRSPTTIFKKIQFPDAITKLPSNTNFLDIKKNDDIGISNSKSQKVLFEQKQQPDNEQSQFANKKDLKQSISLKNLEFDDEIKLINIIPTNISNIRKNQEPQQIVSNNVVNKQDVKDDSSLVIQERFSQIYPFEKNAFVDSRQSKEIFQDLLKQDIFGNMSMSAIETLQSPRRESTMSNIFILQPEIPQVVQQEEQFLEPILQKSGIELFQQCTRLNSISINLSSSSFNLFSQKHKQILKNLAYELLMATQALQNFNEEIAERQKKQKRVLTNFSLDIYKLGEWMDVNYIKNINLIKPTDPFPRRVCDFNQIKDTLKNSVQILNYVTDFIEQLKFQINGQFKKKYIELRSSMNDIFINLKKISQDLFMKSIVQYLPNHYYEFYNYLKSNFFIPKGFLRKQIKEKIQEREFLLSKIQFYKNEHDPLSCSSLANDIEQKAKAEILLLKSIYFNKRNQIDRK